MQAWIWGGCAGAVGVAALSSLADRRRNKRSDPDKVGFMPWPLIMILAMITATVFAALALKIG